MYKYFLKNIIPSLFCNKTFTTSQTCQKFKQTNHCLFFSGETIIILLQTILFNQRLDGLCYVLRIGDIMDIMFMRLFYYIVLSAIDKVKCNILIQ